MTMQIVGTKCLTCKATIAVARDAVECVICEVGYHKRCLSNSSLCPQCGTDFVEGAQKKRAAAAAKQRMDLSTGRNILLFAVGVLVALQVLDLLGAWVVDHSDSPIGLRLLGLAFTVIAGLSLLTGRTWAKIWVQLVMPLNALAAGFRAARNFGDGDVAVGSVDVAISLVCVWLFILVSSSPRVSAYMQSWR